LIVAINEDCKVALDLLVENDEQFKSEKLRLQAEAEEARQQRDTEAQARQQAEAAHCNTKKYSEAQERLYIDDKFKKWKTIHYFLFIIGFILSIFAVIASLFLWLYLKDSGCLSLLGILAITIPLTASGRKIFSIKAKSEIRENLLNDYRNKLKN
jgi:cation transport ATPase